MACCQTLTGLSSACEANMGGIKTAWIACSEDVPKASITISNGEVTAITSFSTAFKKYEFKKNTGNTVTTPTVTDGGVFYDSSISLQFAKQETVKKLEIEAIAQSDMKVIIQDNNGKYWFYGYENDVTLSDGSVESGTALTDFNGYNITLSSSELALPYEVQAEVME